MTTEHVSVPRELIEALVKQWKQECMAFADMPAGIPVPKRLYLWNRVADLEDILSRAAPSVPTINIKCETRSNEVIGTATLNVLRVEAEDDGSFTAVTDHWPTAPRVVTDSDVDIAIDAAHRADTYPGFVGYRKVAMRAALESFASLLHTAVPDELTAEQASILASGNDLDADAIKLGWRLCRDAMLAAAPQAGEK